MKAIRKLQDLSLPTSLFLILAVLITLICVLVFGVSQQIYRQSANDPQVQISEDMASYASSGKDLSAVMPKMETDISQSLVWFVMFFDDSGKVVASNAKLDGQTPIVPVGVLEHAKISGQNRVTWQPKEGVRIAAVITKYNGGEVLVGRSLRETESRIHALGKKVMIAWIVMLASAFIGTWLLLPKKSH